MSIQMTLMIGEVARRSGLPASTLRYYESIGLIAPPPRVSGRRTYEEATLDRLRVITLAQSVGFSLAQIGALLDGFPVRTPASERWRSSTRSKIEELEQQAAGIERMLGLLRHLADDCECGDLVQCAGAWTDHRDEVSRTRRVTTQARHRSVTRPPSNARKRGH